MFKMKMFKSRFLTNSVALSADQQATNAARWAKIVPASDVVMMTRFDTASRHLDEARV